MLNGAKAFVFLSLYEGFGMPVIEAMACGVPVLTSNSSSLKEIAEGAALLVDETSITEMKKGLLTLYQNETLRSELVEKGMKRAKEYSWDNAGKKLIKVYERLWHK